jgi:choice-of-anchor C domain-containing protein
VMEKDGSFEIVETRVMKKAANLLHNGSFEQGPDVGDFQPLDPGSTAIPGWTVTRGQIDDIGDAWAAADGYHSLDLHGSPGFGGIQQTFPTAKGRRYRVTFALAGSPEAEVRRKRIGIGAAGQSAEFAFDSTGKSATKMGWVVKEWEFVANDAETTLEIYTLENTDGLHGPALDDVRVQAVPGPSLLVNGSFEDGPDLSGWQHLDDGAGSMPGWKVTRGEVSIGGWQAEDGNRSLFFPGSSPHGALEQTFPTTKGRRYRLIFRMSANPNNGWWAPESSTTSLRVSVAGQTREFPFDADGKSPYNMGWVMQIWDFEAAGDRTTLEFSTPETDRGYWIGPALDHVRVMPLHEAGTGSGRHP